jgi:hypothetical protein
MAKMTELSHSWCGGDEKKEDSLLMRIIDIRKYLAINRKHLKSSRMYLSRSMFFILCASIHSLISHPFKPSKPSSLSLSKE